VPRVLPGKDFGIDDPAVLVRVSTQKEKRGQILKIKHPIIGWVKPQIYYAITTITEEIRRIDPIQLIALVTLAVLYKKAIEVTGDVVGWLGDLFDNLGLFISGQLSPIQTVEFLSQLPFFSGLAPLAEVLGAETEAFTLTGRGGLLNEAQEWLLAFGSAAITIVFGGQVIKTVTRR
jgi:hypothetical protein